MDFLTNKKLKCVVVYFFSQIIYSGHNFGTTVYLFFLKLFCSFPTQKKKKKLCNY